MVSVRWRLSALDEALIAANASRDPSRSAWSSCQVAPDGLVQSSGFLNYFPFDNETLLLGFCQRTSLSDQACQDGLNVRMCACIRTGQRGVASGLSISEAS